jgi:hypothetical protein
MAHEALREVNKFLRVLETCRHPGCHRVPSHVAVGALGATLVLEVSGLVYRMRCIRSTPRP